MFRSLQAAGPELNCSSFGHTSYWKAGLARALARGTGSSNRSRHYAEPVDPPASMFAAGCAARMTTSACLPIRQQELTDAPTWAAALLLDSAKSVSYCMGYGESAVRGKSRPVHHTRW